MGELGSFAEDEVAELQSRYAGLRLVQPGRLEGLFDLSAEFDGNLIQDDFYVRVDAPRGYPAAVPNLFEIGGRTEAIAQLYGIRRLIDLHVYPGGRACVCVPQMAMRKFPPGSNVSVFVENLAVPYLYGLSHFERHGYWPWGEYSHGGIGVLEFYAEGDSLSDREELTQIVRTFRVQPNWTEYYKQFRRPSAKRRCLCGSRRPFDVCHPEAWRGVQQLSEELRREGIRHFG